MLAAGDVVVLRSGGPLMTVLYLNAGYSENEVICAWFLESGEKKSDVFPPSSITHASEDR